MRYEQLCQMQLSLLAWLNYAHDSLNSLWMWAVTSILERLLPKISTNVALRSRHSLFGWIQEGLAHGSTENSAWRRIMRSYTERKHGLAPTLTLGCNQEQYLKMLAKPVSLNILVATKFYNPRNRWANLASRLQKMQGTRKCCKTPLVAILYTAVLQKSLVPEELCCSSHKTDTKMLQTWTLSHLNSYSAILYYSPGTGCSVPAQDPQLPNQTYIHGYL